MVKDITQEQIKELSELTITTPQEALQLCEEFSRLFPAGSNWKSHKGGFLIDIGVALNQASLVERGITSLLDALQTATQEQIPYLSYNTGNGYSALYAIERQNSNFRYNPDSTPLRSANHHYREVLRQSNELEARLAAQIHVNYGNSLSHGGRSIEAIAEFDKALRVFNDHPMALGNLGLALLHYSMISRQQELLHEAQDVLTRAIADNALEHIGGYGARDIFTNALNDIRSLLADTEKNYDIKETELTEQNNWNHRYKEFCLKNQLFLNLCLPNRQSLHPSEDNVGFGIVTDVNDTTTFPKLSRITNELKERFATSRLLLFEALNSPYQIESIDENTHYVDNLDYGVYGISIGKMKLSFEAAYNILDKIAFFVDAYFNLKAPPKSIDFQSIWQEPKKVVLRSSLLHTGNYHLYGLYSLSQDFAPNAYYGHLRKIRNVTTHRYLIPHVERINWMEEIDGSEYHLDYRQFKDNCIELLKTVRSAIIYLISCIAQEEQKKRTKATEKLVSVYANKFTPFNPEKY